MSYKERFIDVVIESSVSNSWDEAKLEWRHRSSYEQHGHNCICGQDITDVCVITNIQNNNTLEVGNVCVTKFLGIDRKSDFKLIKNDLIDMDLLEELHINKAITSNDFVFYRDIKLKRKLSYKQLAWKNKILLKAKQYVTKSGKGIVDQTVFKNLKTETMNIKKEHTKMLGDFIVAQGYKIKEGKRDKTFTEVLDIVKEIATNLKRLKQSYDK